MIKSLRLVRLFELINCALLAESRNEKLLHTVFLREI